MQSCDINNDNTLLSAESIFFSRLSVKYLELNIYYACAYRSGIWRMRRMPLINRNQLRFKEKTLRIYKKESISFLKCLDMLIIKSTYF